jgi:hypothetical protein
VEELRFSQAHLVNVDFVSAIRAVGLCNPHPHPHDRDKSPAWPRASNNFATRQFDKLTTDCISGNAELTPGTKVEAHLRRQLAG